MIAEAWKILRACGIRRHHLGHSTGHQIPFVKFYRHRMSRIAKWKAGRPRLQTLHT